MACMQCISQICILSSLKVNRFNGVLYSFSEHFQGLAYLYLKTDIPPAHIEDWESWWLSGCHGSMAEHWWLNPGVSCV